MNAPVPIQGVLMVGGASRRMGRDKALLEIGGQALWRRQLDLLAAVSGSAPWVSGIARPSWLPPGVIFIQDAFAGGPMAGVVTVLQKICQGHALILAVDLPQMTVDGLRLLLQRCSADVGLVPHGERGMEPLAAVYPARAAASGAARLHRGESTLWQWLLELEQTGIMRRWQIPLECAACFTNVNTPEDWKEVVR